VDRGGSRNGQGHEVLGYLRGGLGHIFDALVTWLRDAGHHVHLGRMVHRLEGTDADINAIVTDAGTFPTNVVIGCAQLPDLVSLLPDRADNYRKSLRKIDFLANVCLVLTLNRSLSEFYWTNVTETQAPFVGIIEQTNWAEERDFNHKHVVYLSAYVPREDSRLTMNVSELTAFYLPAIKQLFPNFDEQQIVSGTIWRAPYAQPIVHVGYRHDIPEIISPIANFFVCTMAQIYPHDRQLSNGVAMARKTAEIVNRYLEVLS
jgi:protoporphyrinogen oxidase